jgi:hypothetical protein
MQPNRVAYIPRVQENRNILDSRRNIFVRLVPVIVRRRALEALLDKHAEAS